MVPALRTYQSGELPVAHHPTALWTHQSGELSVEHHLTALWTHQSGELSVEHLVTALWTHQSGGLSVAHHPTHQLYDSPGSPAWSVQVPHRTNFTSFAVFSTSPSRERSRSENQSTSPSRLETPVSATPVVHRLTTGPYSVQLCKNGHFRKNCDFCPPDFDGQKQSGTTTSVLQVHTTLTSRSRATT